MYKIVGTILGIIIGYAISWILTCGIIKVVTICFGLNFSLDIATGIWLIILVLKNIFRVTVKKDQVKDMWFRYLVTFIDVLMVFCLIYFMGGLSWKDNKASIVGFGTMMFSYMVSAALMWIQVYFGLSPSGKAQGFDPCISAVQIRPAQWIF